MPATTSARASSRRGFSEIAEAHHIAKEAIHRPGACLHTTVPSPEVVLIRVSIAAADPLARSGIAALLAGEAEVVAPGEAHDVVVADGPRAGDVPVVALVAGEPEAAEALRGGAAAVLWRDSAPARIGAAVRAVAKGLVVVEPGVARALLQPKPAVAPESLTPRERDVLRLLAEGLPNKLIADRLGISEHTAKFHVNAVLQKLGAQSRTEAVAHAFRAGLVTM
jgi:DNA-binding CsgD family transcriptional regulator